MAGLTVDSTIGMSAAEDAYAQIKEAIITGNLPPGSHVSEQALAQQLSVSRTPVHQAVVQLQSEEWLEVSSRKGIRIAPLDAGKMREIYEVLIGLEGVAVESLASLEGADRSIDEELASAARLCEEALEQKDLHKWAEGDYKFHMLLLERSGNTTLSRVAVPMSEHAHRARLLTVNLRPWPKESNVDHTRILEAIQRREPTNARSALEGHRRRGIATLVPILGAYAPASPFAFTPAG